MDLDRVILSQYLASLQMLKRAVDECPASLWNDPAHKNRFWHIAYHTLFYTHFYLHPTEEDYIPWEKSRESLTSLESSPGDESREPEEEPYSPEDILAFLAFCEQQVKRFIPSLDMRADSGFYWLPMNKLELQFYSIRHIMQHTGELCERLWVEAGIEVGWVGMVSAKKGG